MKKCFLFFSILCLQLLINTQLIAQDSSKTKEDLIQMFLLTDMSQAGLDTFYTHYKPNEKYLKPWTGYGLFATGDLPYDEKMEVIESVLKPKLSTADYALLIDYWETRKKNSQLYLEDIALRYGKYRTCMTKAIDSIEAIYKKDILDYKETILTNLTEQQSIDLRRDYIKYRNRKEKLGEQYSQGRDYMNDLDSLAYTSYKYTIDLPLWYPAVKNEDREFKSDKHLLAIKDNGFFSLYHKFDLAIGRYACDTCANEGSIGRPCYNMTKLETQRDSLTSKKNAIFYLLQYEELAQSPFDKFKNDTIPDSYYGDSQLSMNDLINHQFFADKGYTVSSFRTQGNEKIYQTGPEPFDMMIIEIQELNEKKLEVIPRLNKQIKDGLVDVFIYDNEKVYMVTEDGGLKGHIYMIAKNQELVAIGIMGKELEDPKAWFEEHRKGLRF